MLRITLDVNGALIGEFGVVRQTERNAAGEHRYDVYDLLEAHKHYDTMDGDFQARLGDFQVATVWHDRDTERATDLTECVMDAVDTEEVLVPE